MRPILLATAGSPSASDALAEAIALASLTHAPLLVVSVEHVTLPAIGYTAYGYTGLVSELRRAEHDRADQALAATAAAIEAAGLEYQTVDVVGGIVDEVCRIARERDARMIVIGSHGWSATHRLVFGSVSEGVLRAATCPVLVVRGREKPAVAAA